MIEQELFDELPETGDNRHVKLLKKPLLPPSSQLTVPLGFDGVGGILVSCTVAV